MKIRKIGSHPSDYPPAANFTGHVRRDVLLDPDAPSRVSASLVTFDPGARTAWHTHPLGQTIIITQGTGWVQLWGGEIQEVHAGDVITFAPQEKHWHGASDRTGMSHIAIQEALDGSAVEWLEQVSPETYHR